MPEVEHSIEVAADLDAVWRYVEVLENWAPYVIGFQKLERVDDRQSIWTLRGDVGILSREVDIRADITVWEPSDRVEFTVTGITERLDGDGYFVLRAVGDDEAAPGAAASAPPPSMPAPKPGPFKRLRTRIARLLLRRLTRKSAGSATKAAGPSATSAAAANTSSPAPSASGGPRSTVTFKLRVSPLGPMAPMLELLMGPMLEPAAEDLADQIKADIERS